MDIIADIQNLLYTLQSKNKAPTEAGANKISSQSS